MAVMLSESRQRAAELILALGPERARSVLVGMPEAEVERLLADVARISSLPPERAKQILADTTRELVRRKINADGIDVAAQLLQQLYGPARGEEIARRIDPRTSQPFTWLLDSPVTQIARALREEPPGSVAVALVHLPADAAAQVLRALPDDVRSDVAHRMAALTHVAPDVIEAIDRSMRARIAAALDVETVEVAGTELFVEVLNQTPPKQQKLLIEAIRAKDERLATKILEMLFVFEDIVLLSDRGIQEVLKTVDTMDLALALVTSNEEINERVLKNLSERAAANLREEMEYLQSPRPADVKAAKGRIVAAIRQLEESGAIEIERPVTDEEES
jgi:flagellar motor switch protein FliG